MKCNPKYLIYEVIKKSAPYLDIIKNQYMYIPIFLMLLNIMSYYGKTNISDYNKRDLQQ